MVHLTFACSYANNLITYILFRHERKNACFIDIHIINGPPILSILSTE